MVLVPYEDGMAYGVGFDSLSHEVLGDAVIRTPPEIVSSGETVLFTLQEIQSHTQLSESLDVSASATLKYALTAQGSATAKFVHERSVDQYSVFLLVQTSVTKAHSRMRDVHLNDEASQLLEGADADVLDIFRQRYGDEFAVGMTKGGRYTGLIQIETTREEDKQTVNATLRASGGVGAWSGSVSGDFQSAFKSVSSLFNIRIWSFQEGGQDPNQPQEVVAMGQKAASFPSTVTEDNAIPYIVEMASYETIPLPPGKSPIDVSNQQETLRTLAEYHSRLSDLLASIDYILQHQDQFINPDIPSLNQTANALRDLLNTIHESAQKCFHDYNSCQLPTNLNIPQVNLPQQKASQVVFDFVAQASSVKLCKFWVFFDPEVVDWINTFPAQGFADAKLYPEEHFPGSVRWRDNWVLKDGSVRSQVLEMRPAASIISARTPPSSFSNSIQSYWVLPESIRLGDRFKAEVGFALEDAGRGPVGVKIDACKDDHTPDCKFTDCVTLLDVRDIVEAGMLGIIDVDLAPAVGKDAMIIMVSSWSKAMNEQQAAVLWASAKIVR